MTIEELKSNEDAIKSNTIVNINSITLLFGKYYAINDVVPIKIDLISSAYPKGKDIDIIDAQGDILGSICITTKDFIIPREILTENRFAAYLADVSYSDFISENFVLKNDYAVIKRDRIYEYLKLAKSAPIWGEYYHLTNPVEKVESTKKDLPFITAIDNIEFPTDIHRRNSINTIVEPFAFERFLKKYHQIELLSDLDIVERIKKLGDDIYGIGEIFSELDSKELNRIKIIMRSRISNYDSIIKALEKVCNYPNEAKTIFQKYSKNGNPIGNDIEFDKLLGQPDFSISTLGKNWRKDVKSQAGYDKFILSLSSYWIYRIRCCIAHKRIGEYVIKQKDEKFIADFGESLIDAVIIEIMKKNVA